MVRGPNLCRNLGDQIEFWRLTGYGLLFLGKQWHAPRKAFRPASGLTSYEKRTKQRVAVSATKAREKEMKDEKEAERQVWPKEAVVVVVVVAVNAASSAESLTSYD